MQYSVFPRSGEKLSRLGFGAMRVAGNPQESVEAMLYCLEQGVNFITNTGRSGTIPTIGWRSSFA
jgi:aryl-alcohol dehydrogenase-like predicted oxidoreductase